jgi:hypothetical protein
MSGGLMSSSYAVMGFASDSASSAALRAVSTDFFTTMGIPINEGRPIDGRDGQGAPPVVVVNEAFVRQSIARSPAVGQTVVVTPPGADSARAFAIVGVAGDAKERDLVSPTTPIIYFSDQQASFPHSVLVFKSHAAPPLIGVRVALRELDPSLVLDDVSSLTARVRSSYALQFFLLSVLAVFAACGALLIGMGVYGVTSFVTATQLRATGVRMALGATQSRIVVELFQRAGRLVIVGCSVGVAATLVVERLFLPAALVASNEAVAISLAVVSVLLVTILATAIPAARASSADPLVLLREI